MLATLSATMSARPGRVTDSVAVLRLAWGFAARGDRYARFAQFVRPARATLPYARAVLQHQAPRYIGHNPLGGWMVVGLLACVGALGVTGALYTTDWLWGYAWLAHLHEYKRDPHHRIGRPRQIYTGPTLRSMK